MDFRVLAMAASSARAQAVHQIGLMGHEESTAVKDGWGEADFLPNAGSLATAVLFDLLP
jgi:hypothetical protein